MSKAKQKQRKAHAKQKAIKNAEREVRKYTPSAIGNTRAFYGESKDKLVADLEKIDVSDDRAFTIGFFGALGLPVPDDLAEKYDIKDE